MTARFSRRLAAIRAGAFVGIIAAFLIIVMLPMGLVTVAGMHVAKAWGLGDLAAPLCLAGAIPGAIATAAPWRKTGR
jgi:hypothetical protein